MRDWKFIDFRFAGLRVSVCAPLSFTCVRQSFKCRATNVVILCTHKGMEDIKEKAGERRVKAGWTWQYDKAVGRRGKWKNKCQRATDACLIVPKKKKKKAKMKMKTEWRRARTVDKRAKGKRDQGSESERAMRSAACWMSKITVFGAASFFLFPARNDNGSHKTAAVWVSERVSESGRVSGWEWAQRSVGIFFAQTHTYVCRAVGESGYESKSENIPFTSRLCNAIC